MRLAALERGHRRLPRRAAGDPAASRRPQRLDLGRAARAQYSAASATSSCASCRSAYRRWSCPSPRRWWWPSLGCAWALVEGWQPMTQRALRFIAGSSLLLAIGYQFVVIALRSSGEFSVIGAVPLRLDPVGARHRLRRVGRGAQRAGDLRHRRSSWRPASTWPGTMCRGGRQRAQRCEAVQHLPDMEGGR